MIKYFKPYVGEEEKQAVSKVIDSGHLTHGPVVESFERLFSFYETSKYSLMVNSATSGLFLSLLALGVSSGDEVITSPYTYRATIQAIVHAGAKPVFVDIEQDSLNIDADKIAKKITKRTKAIMVIHMTGQLCNMEKVLSYGLPVIEDSAHRYPDLYQDRGVFRVYSFYANKFLTTGEGGMISFNSSKYLDKLIKMRYHGRVDYQNSYKGFNPSTNGYKYNSTDINAAMGLEQLNKLSYKRKRHQEIAKFYKKELQGMAHFVNDSQYHIFPVWFDNETIKKDFEKSLNCETSLHYPILNWGGSVSECKTAISRSKKTLSLPIYPELEEEDVFK